jgi:hypothetical protein
MLFPDAVFRPRDSLSPESSGKSPQSENPDTTWETLPSLLESKSLAGAELLLLVNGIPLESFEPLADPDLVIVAVLIHGGFS